MNPSLTLVEQLPDELEVRVLSLLVHHAVPLLRHEEAQRHGQVVVDQVVLEPLRALARVLDLWPNSIVKFFAEVLT